MPEHSKKFTITCHGGVADVLRQTGTMVDEARQWAAGYQWAKDLGIEVEDADHWRRQYAEVNGWVDDMERSLLRCLLHLMLLASQSGELGLWWDSDDSLFFQDKTGYHGGMVFHPKHRDGTVRLPVGEWSLHT